MNAPEALILDLLEWIAAKPRPYAKVMAAWRTSCPGLPVWEDAVDLGLVQRHVREGDEPMVELTPAGAERLRVRAFSGKVESGFPSKTRQTKI